MIACKCLGALAREEHLYPIIASGGDMTDHCHFFAITSAQTDPIVAVDRCIYQAFFHFKIPPYNSYG